MITDERLKELEIWIQGIPNVSGIDRQDLVNIIQELLSLREQKRKLVTVASETAEVITKLKKHLGKEGEYSFCSKHGDKLTFTDALIIGQICEDGDSATDKYESLMKELDESIT